MMIAYNLCYSTCCGRVAHALAEGQALKLGVRSYALPRGVLRNREDVFKGDGDGKGGGSGDGVAQQQREGVPLLDPHELVLTPNGVAFTPPNVRPGVVPRMLREILTTRVMVKAAMKRVAAAPHAADTTVRLRCLNARQLALKLIANVTYGYASAGFSGTERVGGWVGGWGAREKQIACTCALCMQMQLS